MRRFRNPRYAPEGLERKLNPSGFGIPVTAEIAPASSPSKSPPTNFDPPPPPPSPTAPPAPGSGEPPWGGPTVPNGPTEPDCYPVD